MLIQQKPLIRAVYGVIFACFSCYEIMWMQDPAGSNQLTERYHIADY